MTEPFDQVPTMSHKNPLVSFVICLFCLSVMPLSLHFRPILEGSSFFLSFIYFTFQSLSPFFSSSLPLTPPPPLRLAYEMMVGRSQKIDPSTFPPAISLDRPRGMKTSWYETVRSYEEPETVKKWLGFP